MWSAAAGEGPSARHRQRVRERTLFTATAARAARMLRAVPLLNPFQGFEYRIGTLLAFGLMPNVPGRSQKPRLRFQ